MKVAYVLNTPRAASHKVAQMILPQLEGNPWPASAGMPVRVISL